MKTLARLLAAYFTLGANPIIGPLPSQLLNGTPQDATQVMADLQFIISQVNANAQPLAGTSAVVPQYVAAVGGTPNAITLTPTTPISSYQAGQAFSFIALAQNTGATTIATSGLAARNLLYADGTAMSGGELQAGSVYMIEDNGGAYTLMNSAQANGLVAWTPTISFGGTSTGITYTQQSGISSKIGRFVFFAFSVILSNKGSSVGQAAVNGLPYTVNAGWLGNNAGPVVSANLGFGGGFNVFGYNLGTKSLNLVNVTAGGVIALFTDTSFTNTTQLAGSAFYAV